MTVRAALALDTLTIRIPMRLQRQGGRKADDDAGRGGGVAAKGAPR
jgi:hypothetical protein